ncbi:DNA polymerase kappa [Chlorella sorokiniana]|uniref:DNA polymerase kappa n=1 Tax=Chlorella sorokiniana TaxID=3076 RepID=A0A2P6TXH7_CHLSO|nr:DNA polymerase kappa [Chlorella sorokiniana]|eukprot:PRW58761.1 DNA polymerase kappa [Chlorella sorokiniana]
MGRSSRATKAAAQLPATADVAGSGAEPATPTPHATAARSRGAPIVVVDTEEELPPPPEPPLILPSTAAAVRTKERQLAGQGVQLAPTAVGGVVQQEDWEEDADLDAAADAALEQQQEGPGMLQRAVDAASSAAAGAYAAAAPVVKQAVAATADFAASGLGVAAGAAEAVAEAAGPEEGEDWGPEKAGTQQAAYTAPTVATHTGPLRPRDAAATLAAAEHAATAAPRAAQAQHKATAAVTTAAVLPASAAAPAATGQGYFPTVGATAPAPVPEPTMSGALSAKRVVAERLTGLAAQARMPPATPAGRAGQAARARGKGPRGAPGMDEDWISELVERLWPFIKASVEQMAWEMLPDILEQSEPAWIHDINLKKLVLGDKEPDISNIRVWMDDNDTMDDCYLEFDFEWRSKQIQVLPASMDKAWIPNIIEDKLKDLLDFTVGVEDAMLKGRVRVTLRPLLYRIPVVGAVQVSLVEQPEFDFDLTLGNSTNVPMEPALKSWIKQTLQDMVFASYVSPEHFFLQIDPEAQDLERPVGVLAVEVVEATKVPRMDFFTRSSPFVELYVRTSMKRQTAIKSTTKHPRWSESFEFPVHVAEHQELRMVLYDYDWASANDEIGRACVRVKDLPPGQTQDLWLDVGSESEKELADAKGDMRKRDRAMVAAAKPLRGGSTKRCQLHIRATYYTFTDAEEKLIMRGQRQGMAAVLDSAEGRGMSPSLRRLLQSGMVSVRVARADGLSLSSLFGRPSVKGKVRAGDQEKELAAVKASRHGCVQFDQPVELAIGAELTRNKGAKVVIELQSGGLFGGDTIGTVQVPLGDLMQRKHMHQEFRLEGADSGRVELELQWKPYFG